MVWGDERIVVEFERKCGAQYYKCGGLVEGGKCGALWEKCGVLRQLLGFSPGDLRYQSGNAIMFWEDNWIGMGKLRDLFSRLYHLDVVNDAILGNKGFWREDEWDIQLKKIPRTSASGGSMMMVVLQKIPVQVVLDNMGIDLHSVLCPCCEESIESLDHCFVLCPKVKPIWDRVLQWWDVGMRNIFSVEDVLNLAQANIFTGIKREIWKGIVWSVLYFIWTFRNQVVFKGNESKILDLFKEVQGRAFEWIAARMKKDHLKWEDWISGLIVPS
ncbi:RNA-directed DNA polymerase, eukaryota, reverse transcriptase zinc-binding domain protein [Tanacetum coccineum]